MNRIKEEDDKRMIPKDQINSPSSDDGSCGGSLGGGGILKKGPWTSAEDAILVEYVKKHGEGNWNAVQKHSGLSRCGKSCRLRWANHLRPNLKKGAITPEEERMIIELHSRMGNKWARMAAHLPGRTDNEIKNYWNTRIKRRQRANLPLYPPEVCFDAPNENLQSQDCSEFSSIDKQHSGAFQCNTFDITQDGLFDNFRADQGTLSYASSFPVSDMLTQGFASKNFSIMNPTGNPLKRFWEPETLFSGVHGGLHCGLPTSGDFSTGPPEKIHRSFGSTYPYDPDPGRKNLTPFGGAILGSHAVSNGNFSTSQALPGSTKLELPSLQYQETDPISWHTLLSTPPLEVVDSYIQSPPAAVSVQPDCVSARNSGLLEALLHEAQTRSNSKTQQSEKSSSPSVFTPNNMVESSTLDLCDEDWGEYSDPISPLGLTAPSAFGETPPTSGSSLDEFSPFEAPSGSDVMLANTEHVSTPSAVESDVRSRSDFLRPDALLGSAWLDESSRGVKEHSMLNNAIATLLSDGLCNEYEHMPSETVSSRVAQGLGLDSYPWNNMPRICQMSEIP